MRFSMLCLLISGAGLIAAQPQFIPVVRSVKLTTVSTSPKGLPSVSFEDVLAAWKSKQVKLVIENKLDVDSIEKAKDVIREMYGNNGGTVRVEHRLTPIAPQGSVEVDFQVIELCRCE